MAENLGSVPQKREDDAGKLEYGCEHYQRCKIRAPCCRKVFSCCHCHNETMSAMSNPKDHHEIVRLSVHFATTSSRLLKYAQAVESRWVNAFVIYANFMMILLLNSSFIVKVEGFVGLGVETSFFTVISMYLFDSIKGATVMKCGHTMHWDWLSTNGQPKSVSLPDLLQDCICNVGPLENARSGD